MQVIIRRLFVGAICTVTMYMPSWSLAVIPTNQNFERTPADIEADNLTYNQKTSTATASGNVVITQGKRSLKADKLTYNSKEDLIKATGDLVLTEPNGTKIHATEVSLQHQFEQGSINNISAYFTDDSQAHATKAQRIDKHTLILEDASYTPCPVSCKSDTKRSAPLWQIRANKTTLDTQDESISYQHAFFELYGVPIGYTPYFSHAAPNAKRKTGFLTPKYRSDSILGTTVSTPFYYNISTDKDITLTPTITSDQGGIMSGQYRQLFESGSLNLEGSVTNPDRVDESGSKVGGDHLRGHIQGNGQFDLNRQWSWGFDASRSTDDTYLRRYNVSDENTLTSKAYLNYLSEDKNLFFNAQGLSFQGLQQDDDPGETPTVLPYMRVSYKGAPMGNMGNIGFEGNTLALKRDEGISTNRASGKLYWSLPYTTAGGHVFEWRNSVRSDIYVIEDATNSLGQLEDDTTSRIIPQTELNWSYPLIAAKTHYNIIVEPKAQAIVSPYGGTRRLISNEDSQDIEFSDINLFSDHHFSGTDLIEQGPRANIGIKTAIDHHSLGYTSFMIGQHFQRHTNNQIAKESGLRDQQSDIVGRIAHQYNNMLDVAYAFRIDKRDYTPTRNVVHAGVNFERLRLNFDYLASEEAFENSSVLGSNREQFQTSAELKITDQWRLTALGNRDIEDGSWREAEGGLHYGGSCINLSFIVDREFTRDRDASPSTSVMVQVSLRNLTD